MSIAPKEMKHHDACTPQRDLTPNSHHNFRNNKSPQSNNTPNLRLRITNNNAHHGMS